MKLIVYHNTFFNDCWARIQAHKLSRVQRINFTDKFTEHVILYKFKSDLRAGNSGEEWGRPAKYTKHEAHFRMMLI